MKGTEQVLVDGFRYRRNRSARGCVKGNCNGRVPYDGTIDEIWIRITNVDAPNPNEMEKAPFNDEIRQKAELCRDPSKLIIDEACLNLFSDTAMMTVPRCTVLQLTIQRIRHDKDHSNRSPKTFFVILFFHRIIDVLLRSKNCLFSMITMIIVVDS